MPLTILQTIFFLLPSALCATYYVAPTGSDNAAGTLTAPYKSIQVAVDKAVAGNIIYLRGGTYALTKNILVKKSGTSSARITLAAYQTEIPIVDGEALTGTPAPVGGSIASADRGILHNYETGFQLQGASVNNQILYLDSYEDRDPRKNGESADGLRIKEGSGTGSLVKGCRLGNNVDAGLDFWEFKSKITVVDTLAWGNGFNRNCFAFSNAAKGFTDNSQPGNFVLSRNTAWKNADVGFKVDTAVATLTGNLAAGNKGNTSNAAQVTLSSAQKQSGNSWQASAVWTDASFKSVDVSLVQAKRVASTGKIAVSNFLLPANGAAIGATTAWS